MIDQIQAWLAQRFKSAADIGAVFSVAGILLIGIGSYLEVTVVINLGVTSFGAAVIAWGVNALETREVRIFQRGVRISERIDEVFARLWGIVFVGSGLVILGYGILSLLNPRAPVPNRIRQFFESPQGNGVLLFVAGAIGLLFALSLIFVSDAREGNAFVRFISSLPGRLFGIVLLILFSVLLLVALFQIVAPTPWETLFRILVPQLFEGSPQ